MPGLTVILLVIALLAGSVLSMLLVRRINRLRQTLARTEAARQHDENLAAELLRSSTDLISITELSTGQTRCNACWELLLGREAGEPSPARMEEMVHPDDREPLREAIRMFESGDGSVGVETRVLAREGSVRWIAWNWTRSPSGDLVCRVGRDITDIKRWQGELEESTLELRQRNEELADALRAARQATKLKSEFVANTSHEIRTPMNAVVGMTELLLTTPLTAEQREYADMLRDSAKSLLSILNDLLEFSRLEARSAIFEAQQFDIRETVSAVIHLLYPRAMASNLTLSCFVSPDLPEMLVGDARRLRQVLLNLVSNAVKFTDSGRVVARVGLVAETKERVIVRFEVEDSGIGIAPEDCERIFEPFIQVEGSATRKRGGTGLGLGICRQIVESLGGTIGVTSNAQSGSTFWFTMPFIPQEKRANEVEKPIDVAEDALVGAHILLVEDNAINQHLTRRLLEKEGCKVGIAASGRLALEALRENSYDLILMDVQMPDMDGLTATVEIRKMEPPGQRVPIIALTANAMDGDREQCFTAGMDDYLSKPVSREHLRACLQRWVRRASAPKPKHPVEA